MPCKRAFHGGDQIQPYRVEGDDQFLWVMENLIEVDARENGGS